jgi:hypothetical protein
MVMAKSGDVQGAGSGQEVSDADAAACLSQGHPKSAMVPISKGMKDDNDPGRKLTGRTGDTSRD